MIAFGSSVIDPEPYRRYAEPGLRLAAEPDSEIYAFAPAGSMPRTFNLILDVAGRRDDLEALVLVHPHAEIADPDFCGHVREALRDPRVGVAGCVGATGVRSIAWWEGKVRSAEVRHRYVDHGGGELPAFSWAQPEPAPGEVECVDGLLLVLSPWVVRNLRFDEALATNFGVELDFCLQVRAAGRKVVVANLPTIHHRALRLVDETEAWVEAHIRVAEKWDGRMPGAERNGDDWKARARRAEAEREAARAFAQANLLARDARVQNLERALEEVTGTRSWRLTEPLRRLNHWRAQRRASSRR